MTGTTAWKNLNRLDVEPFTQRVRSFTYMVSPYTKIINRPPNKTPPHLAQ